MLYPAVLLFRGEQWTRLIDSWWFGGISGFPTPKSPIGVLQELVKSHDSIVLSNFHSSLTGYGPS